MRRCFGHNRQLGLVMIMTESLDSNLPAIAGFTLGLFFAGLWLTDTFLRVTSNLRLSNIVNKWFRNRPIIIPALFFLFFPFFTARIFDYLGFFLNQDIPSQPESSEAFGVILKLLPSILGAVVGGAIGLTSSYLMWRKQVSFNKKNGARALYEEISRLEVDLKNLLAPYSAVLVLPIYSKEGLFFIFNREISFFDPELSTKIFNFYGWLNRAENIRQIDTEKVTYSVVERQVNSLIEAKKWIKTNEQVSKVPWTKTVVNREALIERLYNNEYNKRIEAKTKIIKDYLTKAYDLIQILKQQLQNEFDA